MNAKQLERASYLAAHAVLATNTSAPHLATPGARRSYMVDTIAQKIRSIFELHCSALDESTEWNADLPRIRSSEHGSVNFAPDGADSEKLHLVMKELH
jgi:hypothetical protein